MFVLIWSQPSTIHRLKIVKWVRHKRSARCVGTTLCGSQTRTYNTASPLRPHRPRRRRRTRCSPSSKRSDFSPLISSNRTPDASIVYSWRVKTNKSVSGRVLPFQISSKMTRPHDGCSRGRTSLVHSLRGYPIPLKKLSSRQPGHCGSSSVFDLNPH